MVQGSLFIICMSVSQSHDATWVCPGSFWAHNTQHGRLNLQPHTVVFRLLLAPPIPPVARVPRWDATVWFYPGDWRRHTALIDLAGKRIFEPGFSPGMDSTPGNVVGIS